MKSHRDQLVNTRPAHDAMERGFTIIELLVVISVAVIALGILVPVIGAAGKSSRIEGGVNTVQAAMMAARQYANRSIADMGPSPITGASYSGSGMLFTPAGEIRMIENDQTMLKTGGTFMESDPDNRNGFRDIPDREYILLPKGVGVVGIGRTGAQLPALLAPPFAVRYSKEGTLLAATKVDTVSATYSSAVYYDANYDSELLVTGTGANRGTPFPSGTAPYNPDLWDPDSDVFVNNPSSSSNAPGLHEHTLRYKLPFEEIETVVGVIVFDETQMRSEGLTLVGDGSGSVIEPINTAASTWILNNGKPLFFGRYGGTLMKEITQ